MFLRNEASLIPALRFLELDKCVQSFIEGALMRGLVAKVEGQLLFVDCGCGEALVLEANGALGEPMGLGHPGDEEFFGGGRGVVFVKQVMQERFKGGAILAGNDELAGG